LPTNYIDFTTSPEVAGFFAADNPKGHLLDAESCIVCLETADLKKFWANMPAKYPPPRFIGLEVPNLWRLEAQEGCFLFCDCANFEHIYDLDRIIFPYTGPFPGIPRSKIYPLEKSALEIALDQYFMNEKLIAGTRMVYSLSGFREASHMTMEDTGGWNSDLVSSPIPTDSSWDKSVLAKWIQADPERYSHVSAGPVLTISFLGQVDPSSLHRRIESKVLSDLERNPSLRTQSVRWTVEDAELLTGRPNLPEALSRLWNGVRILPYTPDQIAHCIGRCAALWAAWEGQSSDDIPFMRAASTCFGECLEIEFGASDGSYSRSFASKRTLAKAVRNDVSPYLNPRYADQIHGNIVGMLQAIQDPSLLFDFSRLADAFVREIAPFQVLHRRSDLAVFYSPARLDRFGLP